MANDISYGLAAYVQSNDNDRARRVAAQMRAGDVFMNYPAWDSGAPFGGYNNRMRDTLYGLSAVWTREVGT